MRTHLLPFLFLTSSLGCATLHQSPVEDVHLWHTVIVRLNTPRDSAAREKVVTASQSLRDQIPQIRALYVGPVLPGRRPHQDSSFDVEILMGFASPADLEAYETHPAHLAAVRDVLKPLARDFTTFDFTTR